MLPAYKKFHIRKLQCQPSGKIGDYRIFRIEMIGIYEGKAELGRALKLMIFYIRCYIGITSGLYCTCKAVCARAAHDSKL